MKEKIGIGYDVHRLIEGRKLILGGVEIEHKLGLDGHSDADVLCHAIADALLGAAKLGDIGQHFPDTDPKYKDACSLELLKNVGNLLNAEGYQILDIDSVIAVEKPKIFPFRNQMRQNIAKALNLDLDQIGIKATTTEGLGLEGREEGISAQAVALIGK